MVEVFVSYSWVERVVNFEVLPTRGDLASHVEGPVKITGSAKVSGDVATCPSDYSCN